MNEELLSEIRNKLTLPMLVLERTAQGDVVPQKSLELAVEECRAAVKILKSGYEVHQEKA